MAGDRFGDLVNGYTAPAQLGIDRWSGLVAAWHQLKSAVIVVGCGTAITVDSVDLGGRHLGGVIFPGLSLAQESFYGATGVSRASAPAERQVSAHDTAAAVASGVRWSIAGGINELLKRLNIELGGAADVWFTGGDAAELLAYVDTEARLVDDLVYQGMVLLAEQ
ncbi:MAG: type III pantothenate kinase [Immundisolibacteraceae bacterium]|nr:type III pantothenate kinase [Immundisolibacteraceae bacterium]